MLAKHAMQQLVMAPSRPPRPPSRLVRDPKELLKKRGADLIRKISDKDRFAIFLQPVDVDLVEGYTDLISRPMDLSTAQKNLDMGVYRTPMELRADLDLIWSNCCTFNADDSIYFKEAVRLRALATRYYDDLVRLLAKDGVAAALGLSSSRQNGPSSARMSQKRPPRHRASSQNSDFSIRMRSPSLQTSEPNSEDLDADSQSASASAPAANLPSFRDVHLRRARGNFDAAVAAASTTATESRQATEAAGLRTGAPLSGSQIYNGPYGILAKKRESEPIELPPRKFPIMFKQRLKDSCAEIPVAWRRVGRWHSRGGTASKLLTKKRVADVFYGGQFQKYVDSSAPMARRLLATILDPNAVSENDMRQRHLTSSDGLPRSGECSGLQYESQPNIASDGRINPISDENGTLVTLGNGVTEKIDIDSVATGLRSKPDKDSRHRMYPADELVNNQLSESDFGKSHVVFKRLLEEATGPEHISKFSSAKIEELAGSAQNTVAKNTVYRLRSLLKAKGIDSAFTNHILAQGQEKEDISQRQRDISSNDHDNQVHRRNLDHLLSSNHETMLNILRLRALRENAEEAALENLEDREREYAERLADGMSLAVRKLPPRFVAHPLDVAETAISLAQTINNRQQTPNE